MPQHPQANTQLSDFKPRDLNIEPKLPYGDAEFDVVTCVVSVDYLNKPLEIFREVAHFSRMSDPVFATSQDFIPKKKKKTHPLSFRCSAF